MVNYCCVLGCGRNSRTSKHLVYYGMPKDNSRLEKWLQVLGREDLSEKNLIRPWHRVCSRHFSPTSMKNKHLCADAVPTLCLPNSETGEPEVKQSIHNEIICNNCKNPILGFRYKCITCPNYDLCSKCEMFETHSDHFLLRIPKPVNFRAAHDLIKKWQQSISEDSISIYSRGALDNASSDDDVPITKYAKQNDAGTDLSEDIKVKIRNEVTRVLNIKHTELNKKKRKKESKKKDSCKKKKTAEIEDESCSSTELKALVPEVVFADVNDIRGNQMYIKDENSVDLTPSLEVSDTHQPMTDLNFADTDFMLTNIS